MCAYYNQNHAMIDVFTLEDDDDDNVSNINCQPNYLSQFQVEDDGPEVSNSYSSQPVKFVFTIEKEEEGNRSDEAEVGSLINQLDTGILNQKLVNNDEDDDNLSDVIEINEDVIRARSVAEEGKQRQNIQVNQEKQSNIRINYHLPIESDKKGTREKAMEENTVNVRRRRRKNIGQPESGNLRKNLKQLNSNSDIKNLRSVSSSSVKKQATTSQAAVKTSNGAVKDVKKTVNQKVAENGDTKLPENKKKLKRAYWYGKEHGKPISYNNPFVMLNRLPCSFTGNKYKGHDCLTKLCTLKRKPKDKLAESIDCVAKSRDLGVNKKGYPKVGDVIAFKLRQEAPRMKVETLSDLKNARVISYDENLELYEIQLFVKDFLCIPAFHDDIGSGRVLVDKMLIDWSTLVEARILACN